MVTANVNGHKIRIPERFTIDEWCALQKFDFDAPLQWPQILEHITDISASVYRQADEESLQLFMGFVITAMNARKRVELPDFNKLNFGQFVDLDCYVSIGIDKHIKDMLTILETDTPWAPQALWSIEQFILWRTSVYRRYAQLFGLEDKDFKDFVEEQDEQDPMAVSRGWYNVIVELAGEDLLKMDQITEEPLDKVLTFLQIKKEKQIAAAQEARKLRKV